MNKNFDVTKTNVAVDWMLETTENPRHRFLFRPMAAHPACWRSLVATRRSSTNRMMVEKPY